jgi:hypothetical protein
MNQNSNPLDYLIELCETSVKTGKYNLTKFTVLNAKDELRRLREDKSQTYKNIAWASINNHGDFYNLTLHYNRFQNQDALIPLYCNEKEFKEKYGKLSK